MQPKNNLLNWKLLESLERTGNLTQACIENDCDLSTASRQLAALEGLGCLPSRSEKKAHAADKVC